jgi:ubiquinone biosynthesis protein COQ4
VGNTASLAATASTGQPANPAAPLLDRAREVLHFSAVVPPNTLSGLASLVALARDPGNTSAVFGIVDGLRHLAGGKFERRVLDHMRLRPETASLIEARQPMVEPDVAALAQLPEGTLGRAFADHLGARGLSVDFYPVMPVRDDASFVAMRMRRTHDVWHVVTGFDTDVPGELGLQAFVLAQLHTPLATLILTVGLLRSLWEPLGLDATMDAVSRGWSMGRACAPLFAQRWELVWERSLATLRSELGLGAFFAHA